jgi:hypothetical protein
VLNARFELLDICSPTRGFRFVSDSGQAALEELAPSCVAFFPLNLKAPEHMLTAKSLQTTILSPTGMTCDTSATTVWYPPNACCQALVTAERF